MSVTILSADRQALRECEEAERFAEAMRQEFCEVRDGDHSRSTLAQVAIIYAEAASNAALARKSYERSAWLHRVVSERFIEMEKEFGPK